MAADILLKEITVKGQKDTSDLTQLSGKTMGPDSMGTLVYPLAIGQDSFYPESIKFTVYQRTSANWKNVKKSFTKAVQTLEDAWYQDAHPSDAGSVAQQKVASKAQKEFLAALKDGSLADKGLRWIGEKAQYLQDETMAGPAFDALTGILKSTMSGLNQRTIEEAKQLGSTYLNMPNEITFAEEAMWEGADLGMVGALGKTGTPQAIPSGVLSNFGSLVGGGTGALVGMLAKSIGPAAGAVLGTLGGTNAQKGIEASFSNIANPYKEMTFSGIGFRQFSFNFVFRARNDTEVAMIQKIIERFRFYSKPTYNTTFGSGILNYPQEFRIEFLTKDQMTSSKTSRDRFIPNPHIPQIKMCVCKNVTTNYASQNTWRALKDGHPVEISLALTFEETELITGEDVIGNTEIGRFKGSGGKF